MTRRHHALEGPRLRGRGPARAHRRAARALLAPPAHPRDRPRGPAEAARRQGAAARRRRPRLARPRSTSRRPASARSGIVDDDVVDLSNLQRQVIHTTDRIGVPKVDSAEETIHALNPDVNVVKYPVAPRRLEHHGDHRGLRRDRRRRRQLPHALPAQRRVGAPADPGGRRPRSSASRASSRSSSPTRARATAACTRRRRPPSWRRPAAPTACSACCRARWACSRPPRSSS